MIDPALLLAQSLRLERLTAVVDIGANPVDGDPPYKGMLECGLCTVTGFEPHAAARAELLQRKGPLETYLPDAVGDGLKHDLHMTAATGMTSLLDPDPARLSLFNGFENWGKVNNTLPLLTRRLDDIDEVVALDYLKIDIQGGELMVFRGGRTKLAGAVAIQTEVSFIPLYVGQPSFGEIDVELRSQGFVPHAIFALKHWAIAPMIFSGNFRVGKHQVLEADVVYVRDFGHVELMSDAQLGHLVMISHHVYASYDLAYHCLVALAARRAIEPGVLEQYRVAVGATLA
jgi:FkbM family methyltransferase